MNEVQLRAEQQPRFPDRCVRCKKAETGDEIRVGTISKNILSLTFWGLGPRIGAPACSPCAQRFRYLNRLKTPISLAIPILGCGGVMLLSFLKLGIGEGITVAFFWGSIMLGILTHMWFWDEFFPQPFFWYGVSNWPFRATHIGYEFRSKEYAREFAALNGTQEAS